MMSHSRKIAAESYPVMKVVPVAAQGSHDRCMERIKHTMTAWLPDMYRTINGQLTDITVWVIGKYQVKQKCNAWATDKTFFERLKNVFVPERVRQGSHVLLFPRRCTSSVWSHGPPFHTRYSPVSMRSLTVIVPWTQGQCPEHLWLTCCMSGSSLAVNQVQRTSTDANWTSTRQGMHKFQTKRMPGHSYCTSSGHLFQVESVQSFVFHRTERTSPDEERFRWMRNGQETHADGDKRIKNFVLRRTSINAIRYGVMWQTLLGQTDQ